MVSQGVAKRHAALLRFSKFKYSMLYGSDVSFHVCAIVVCRYNRTKYS